MAAKDLSQFLRPNLDIKSRTGKVYSVPPPTAENGLILATVVTIGINQANGRESSPEDVERFEEMKGRSLAEISLSEPVFRQMVEDGLPEDDIDRFALYAQYFWLFGEEFADNFMMTVYLNEGMAGPDPKGSTALKTGLSTGSGNPTRTASTPGTGSRPATSDRKAPSGKRAASRGKTS